MSGKKRTFGRRLLGWMLIFLIALWAFTLIQVFLLRFINPPLTMPMLLEGRWKALPQRSERLLDSWRPLHGISSNLRKAVLAAEDQRFLSHHGFDFVEVKAALRDMVKENVCRGASTITMQTARSVFLWPARTFLRKILEGYYAVLLELFWGKERILEVYLNTVDWGSGLRGAEMAARKYFDTSCSRLTAGQAAMLAAVLPSPHRWSPAKPNPWVKHRQKRILVDMRKMPLVG